MKITSRNQPTNQLNFKQLPALKPGETLIVYQEVSQIPDRYVVNNLSTIADVLQQVFPNNLVIVNSMINGVKQTEFEIK